MLSFLAQTIEYLINICIIENGEIQRERIGEGTERGMKMKGREGREKIRGKEGGKERTASK